MNEKRFIRTPLYAHNQNYDHTKNILFYFQFAIILKIS